MKKDNTLALMREELVLLKNSEESKDKATYGNLYYAAIKYDEITKEDLVNGEFDETAKFILTNGKENLYKNIVSEWTARKVEDMAGQGQNIRCQLCNTKNRFIYYILNTKNNTELHVGSTCIKKFNGIDNLSVVHREFKSQEKVRNELQRTQAFLKYCPDANNFIKKARKQFIDFPILLPRQIYIVLECESLALLRIYHDFRTKGDIKNIALEVSDYKKHQDKYNKYWKKAEQHYSETKDSIYICKKREYQWMIDSGNEDLLKQISRKGGVYSPDTICEVYNHEFVVELQQVLKRCCEDSIVKLKDIIYESKELIFQIDDKLHRDYIEIFIPEKEFMANYGWKCCFIEDYKLEINPDNYYIKQSKHNIGVILTRINRVISNTIENYSYSYDEELDRLYLEKGIDGKYKLFALKAFLNKYFRVMNLNENKLRDLYLVELNQLSKKDGWKDISERDQASDIRRLMAKDRRKTDDADE